jgi:hypothetical protein
MTLHSSLVRTHILGLPAMTASKTCEIVGVSTVQCNIKPRKRGIGAGEPSWKRIGEIILSVSAPHTRKEHTGGFYPRTGG